VQRAPPRAVQILRRRHLQQRERGADQAHEERRPSVWAREHAAARASARGRHAQG
jgi:hypothetical protein